MKRRIALIFLISLTLDATHIVTASSFCPYNPLTLKSCRVPRGTHGQQMCHSGQRRVTEQADSHDAIQANSYRKQPLCFYDEWSRPYPFVPRSALVLWFYITLERHPKQRDLAELKPPLQYKSASEAIFQDNCGVWNRGIKAPY